MVQYSDKSMHPAMDVALDRDHDLRLDEFTVKRSITWALAMVPFAVYLGHRMNVVRHWIRINDL